MISLFRIFALILFVAANKTLDICRLIMEEDTICFCDFNIENGLYIKCSRGMLYSNLTTKENFEIKFSRETIKIVCSSLLDWSHFNYDFRKHLNKSNLLIIENCTLENNTHLRRVAEMIGAKFSKNVRLINTVQLNTSGIDFRLFQGFTELQKLYITQNTNLIQINNTSPENFFEFLPNLHILLLSRNAIKKLAPNSFQNLYALELLDLSCNQISELNPKIFDSLFNVRTLYLQKNDLTSLSEHVFTKMRNLTLLSLESNALVSLPETLFQNNKKLETLNLRNNRLQTLPSLIFKELINLNFLNIDENKFVTLPENIFSTLGNLSTLKLRRNQLEYFPDSTFQNFGKLTVLDLQYNKLNNLTDSRFRNMQMKNFIYASSLFAGSLGKNGTTIGGMIDFPLVSIFFNCPNLTILNLGYNNIHKIYDDWFLLSKLKLQILDLSHNNISEVNLNRPLKQENEFHVDLSYNKIERILPSNFSNIKIEAKHQINIYIQENPFICDCKIVDLLSYTSMRTTDLKAKNFNIIAENLKCEKPEKHKGILLTQLSVHNLSC